MPFDGMALAALAAHLRRRWLGARVTKVVQWDGDHMVLYVRHGRDEGRLHIALDPRTPAVWADTGPEAGDREGGRLHPSPFCMLLRKHVESGRLVGLEQPGWERVLYMAVESRLGDEADRQVTLCLELIPGRAQAFLVRSRDGRILDGWPRWAGRGGDGAAGAVYTPPRSRDRWAPDAPADRLLPIVRLAPADKPVAGHLTAHLDGVSPAAAAEVLVRAGLGPDARGPVTDEDAQRVVAALHGLADRCRRGDVEPALLVEEEGDGSGARAVDFWAFPLAAWTGRGRIVPVPDMAAAVKGWADGIRQQRDVDALRQRLMKAVRRHTKRLRRKLEFRRADEERARQAERYRRWADLIMASIGQLGDEPGRESVRVPDWFAEGVDPLPEVDIPLDPTMSPMANAQRYYSQYRKYSQAVALIARQVEETEGELRYLEGIQLALEWNPGPQELEELEEELAAAGYMTSRDGSAARRAGGRGARPGRTARAEDGGSQPYRFVLPDGSEVRVGRNNRQNDRLTMGWARPDDIWLHARNIPGAHVILRPAGSRSGQEPDPEVLETAAMLAAWFSRARASQNVPVDYTLRRYVRKPKGARPGMVIYERQRTLFVTPDPERLERLLREAR